MVACSFNLRSSCSLPNIFLSSLNLLLSLLSAASFAPLLLLRVPPSPFGWALFAVSSTTLLSSLLSFYSRLIHSNLVFISHISLLSISSIGQALSFFSLILQQDPSLDFIGSKRSPRDVSVLSKMEECAMVGMFAVGSVALVFECLVQSWWVADYYEETEAAVTAANKRNNNNNNNNNHRRMGRFRVESVVDEAEEMEGQMESEHGQCSEACV